MKPTTNPTQQPSPRPPKRFRLHTNPEVRPHAEGVWTVCIGKVRTRDGSRLRAKDWYFTGSEASANDAAAKLAKRWAFIVTNWDRLHGSTMRAFGEAFADQPHWHADAKLHKSDKQPYMQTEQDREQRDEVQPGEMASMHADADLAEVFGKYKTKLARAVQLGKKGKSTQWTDEKNIRGAMKFFQPTPVVQFTAETIETANLKAQDKCGSRRTVENYFSALKRMLNWWFGSEYGMGWVRPDGWNEAFLVAKATRTNITILTMGELRTILSVADDWERLLALFGLNCGMYGADIGRLTLDEINLERGYIFWDREKQPENPFSVRHDLWPETLQLVKKFIQPQGTRQRFFDDYRGHKPIQVDCSILAFVDASGNALYRVRPSGKAYSKIDKAWQGLNAKLKKDKKSAVQFRVLRKATNQQLKTMLANKVSDPNDAGFIALAIAEISKEFLGEKTEELARLYSTMGVEGFGRLNKFLSEVGDLYRKAKVFDWSV